MLMRTDPFRDLDRLTQQVFGTAARPAAMPMDAFRQGDTFYIKMDLPGITLDAIDLTVEQNVLTVHATRPGRFACTVSTFCSTVRSIASSEMPGRSSLM